MAVCLSAVWWKIFCHLSVCPFVYCKHFTFSISSAESLHDQSPNIPQKSPVEKVYLSGMIRNPRWLFWPLIGRFIFHYTAYVKSSDCQNVPLWVHEEVCVPFQNNSKSNLVSNCLRKFRFFPTLLRMESQEMSEMFVLGLRCVVICTVLLKSKMAILATFSTFGRKKTTVNEFIKLASNVPLYLNTWCYIL